MLVVNNWNLLLIYYISLLNDTFIPFHSALSTTFYQSKHTLKNKLLSIIRELIRENIEAPMWLNYEKEIISNLAT